MDLTYYPGCSLLSSARDYDESTKAVCAALDISLLELPDWTCCGATSAHSLDEELAISLPALNLKGAEQSGNDMLVPCPLCFNRLKRAKEATRSSIDVFDLSSFFGQRDWVEKIQSRLKLSLDPIKAVCYYGCMATRPPKVTGCLDYENPQSMDKIAEALKISPGRSYSGELGGYDESDWYRFDIPAGSVLKMTLSNYKEGTPMKFSFRNVDGVEIWRSGALIFEVPREDALTVLGPAIPGVNGVTDPRRINEAYVAPVYPEQARKDKIHGNVFLQAVIGTDGSVGLSR